MGFNLYPPSGMAGDLDPERPGGENDRDPTRMTRSPDVNELKAAFRDGRNLMKEMRDGEKPNSEAAIHYSYDVQAGSYVAAMRDPVRKEQKIRQAGLLAEVFAQLDPESILDAGTGETTTLAFLLRALSKQPNHVMAFDISLSRLLYAKRFLESQGVNEAVRLFTGTLDNIPVATNSCDAVMTCHSMEPNGGREREILTELLRVSRRYLVLLEPSWELGSEATRRHITEHRYVRGLPDLLRSLGAKILRHEPWDANATSVNESALIVAEKAEAAATEAEPALRSPIGFGKLVDRGTYLQSPDDGFVFPVVEGIACLLAENGVLASRLEEARNWTWA